MQKKTKCKKKRIEINYTKSEENLKQKTQTNF